MKANLRIVLLLALSSAFAYSSTVKLGFTGATDNAGNTNIHSYYQAQYGVTFSSNAYVYNTANYNAGDRSLVNGATSTSTADALCTTSDPTLNGTCLAFNPFASNTVLQSPLGGTKTITMFVQNGIAGSFSFLSTGGNGVSTVTVYDAQGKAINFVNIDASGTGALKYWSNDLTIRGLPVYTIDLGNSIGYSVGFDQGSSAGYIAFDDLTYQDAGAPIPEPSSVTFMGTGLLGVVFGAVRRRVSR